MRIFQGKTAHPFHLVTPSPWPLITAIFVLTLVISMVLFFRGHFFGFTFIYYGLYYMLSSCNYWWRDVIRESTYEGNHTSKVELGLRMGMVLFIVSEVMFFFGFFWAFFHSSISPTLDIGSIWPPKGILVFDMEYLPVLNTLILISSGVSVTWCHHAIVFGNYFESFVSLLLTISLALLFTWFQYIEYLHSDFTISDSIFGSTFFLSTGFHGCHVFIGTVFLAVSLVRLAEAHYTSEHHLGLEAAIWYWHFVDVVWLVLFLFIYWWGA
jgi:cytochrome c oxidase subunit 3